MSVEQTMIWGVVVITLIVIVFMGPGLWSSSTGYPMIRKPYEWVRGLFRRKQG